MSLPGKVFIVGWYGTETVGDKAILGGILDEYRRLNPAVKFTVASLHPYVTRQTLRELGREARVVPAQGFQFIKTSATSDVVVMGGGPLMGLELLSIPLWAFTIAKYFGKRRVVWGCGLGPLTRARHIDAVRRILLLASEVKLRDSDSVAWARQLTGRADIEQIADPAKEYVLSRYASAARQVAPQGNVLACFLRDWSREYASHLTDETYKRVKGQFEHYLAAYIQEICRRYDLRPALYAMHTFTVGYDDRAFNRRFIDTHLPGATYEQKLSSVASIVQAMLQARLCVCMRFHSVLFAHILGRDYLAIDYTDGGKIKAFLKDESALDGLVSLSDVAEGMTNRWDARVSDYFEEGR